MAVDGGADRQVLVRRRCGREVGLAEERVRQGGHDGLAPDVLLGAKRELQDERLGLGKPNRHIDGGMIEQSARFVANRHVPDVDEVYVGRPIVLQVLEAILAWLPEIAGPVVDRCHAKTLLT